eukprot:1613928-Alexandrium_andersonii.AAC.1
MRGQYADVAEYWWSRVRVTGIFAYYDYMASWHERALDSTAIPEGGRATQSRRDRLPQWMTRF